MHWQYIKENGKHKKNVKERRDAKTRRKKSTKIFDRHLYNSDALYVQDFDILPR